MVRASQLLPHTRYSNTEARSYLSLGAHAEERLSFSVVAGATLEVTLAQFWSSLGPGRWPVLLDLSLTGLMMPSSKTLNPFVTRVLDLDLAS